MARNSWLAFAEYGSWLSVQTTPLTPHPSDPGIIRS
jgi:hypothetical protein